VPPGKTKNENALPYESMMSGLLNRHFHAGAVVSCFCVATIVLVLFAPIFAFNFHGTPIVLD
jgi:hypothetical protein